MSTNMVSYHIALGCLIIKLGKIFKPSHIYIPQEHNDPALKT